jgi:intracellular sulfur oxidation DsrE/DsrF family protein
MLVRTVFILVISLFTASPCVAESIDAPYGSSKFKSFDGIKNLEQLKAVFDFNFDNPEGVKRALIPISIFIKTVQEYGPVSFEPYNLIAVSHGSEVVAFAKQNYQQFKDIVDSASRLAELGVRFEVCSVAAEALGFSVDDFHEFVDVVPLGTYALAYHQQQGYALLPGAATVPSDLINPNNRPYLGTKSSR